jgi:hypothetical protein
MDVNRVLEIANLDKDRLSNFIQPMEFSQQYRNTSLFK